MKQCPGYPPGSCLANIEEQRPLCSFCQRSKMLADPTGHLLRFHDRKKVRS